MPTNKTEKLFQKALAAARTPRGRAVVFGTSQPKTQGLTASNVKVGDSWNTAYGKNVVERIDPGGWIKIQGNTVRIHLQDFDRQVKYDELEASARKGALDKHEAVEQVAVKAKAEREDLKGFGDNLSPMHKGKAVSALTKLIRFNGRVVTKAKMIEEMVRDGYTLEKTTMPKYVFNRRQYNRMDNNEQRQYMKKQEQTKEQWVAHAPDDSGYHELTVTEAQYFRSLHDKSQ